MDNGNPRSFEWGFFWSAAGGGLSSIALATGGDPNGTKLRNIGRIQGAVEDGLLFASNHLRHNAYRRHLGGSGARKMRAARETVSQVIGSE